MTFMLVFKLVVLVFDVVDLFVQSAQTGLLVVYLILEGTYVRPEVEYLSSHFADLHVLLEDIFVFELCTLGCNAHPIQLLTLLVYLL